ncbi:MAG: AbrB/MazE/SpoVT family DNA-binding domain-containing protein [archaeon]
MEKEKCPFCEKGKLRKILDEFEPGIKAEAFKCGNCGETWFSEEIMKKLESMQKAKAEERRLVRIGNSIAAIIPAKIAKKLKLKAKEKIFVEEFDGNILVRVSKL